jgi:hypothetical protein
VRDAHCVAMRPSKIELRWDQPLRKKIGARHLCYRVRP